MRIEQQVTGFEIADGSPGPPCLADI